ncbi:MFS transporter [Desertihabitans brevis]|uniref:MFS transporter n=1 Tax=Desertihabitans brevis TaxID=2268447 RepID=UPI0018F2D3DA|nr:MFS transporter [Desertihabitans brevis]
MNPTSAGGARGRLRQGRALWSWLLAEVCSYLGTRFSMIAIPWLVLQGTGSATATGLVAAAELAPYVLAKVVAGPWVDRWGGRRIAIAGDLLSAVAVVGVWLSFRAGGLSVPVLVGLVAVVGALRGPADVAKQAMIPAVAEHSGSPLERVTGLASMVERLASTTGAAAAGVVIAAVGGDDALLVTAVALLCSAVVVAGLLPAQVGRPVVDAGPPQGYGRSLAEGLRFLRGDSLLLSIVAMVAVTNLLDQAYSAVLVPVWVTTHAHGPEVLGLVFAAMTGSAVAGSALAAWKGHRLPRLVVYAVAFLIAGAPRFWAFALTDSVALVVAVVVVGGLASGFLNPIIGALLVERIPSRLLGRVSGLVSASAWSLMPLGALLGGVLVTRAGLDVALLLGGALYLLTTAAPFAVPSFRAMRRPREPEPVAAPRPAR